MSEPSAAIGTDNIRIRGACTHNLRNVDVDLPLGKLIVITGVSGSGKSSLAFDTIFAEGQRRYLESVSVHTRSLLKQLPQPEVDEVSGLPPTVSVDQRVTTAPARSTLAVSTEIYHYLRLLYARAGSAQCTGCGKLVESQSVEQIVERILRRPERTRIMVLSPMVRSRRGGHKDVLERIGRNGFVRVRVDGDIMDIADVPELAAQKEHSIDAVIDRIILKGGIEQRLRESVELAVRESDGTCVVCELDDGTWTDQLFSTRFSCATCDLNFPTPEPRTFSFNSAWGACPECEGFGIKGVVDDTDDISVFRQVSCDVCDGSRLQPFAKSITFLETRISDFTSLSVDAALCKIEVWQVMIDGTASDDGELSHEAILVARKTLPDIRERLACLQKVGVGYLTLNRVTRTLSGGEFQRARLAACLGTGLHGACFVLDEPTSGLHPQDTQRLLQTLEDIRDGGATVIVVEHDGELMQAADHLVDLGPGAGIEGGTLMYSGPPMDSTIDSPTGRYLRGQLNTVPIDESSNNRAQKNIALTIRGAKRNNLKDVTVKVPLEQFVCITGVSGSGKSTLAVETLLPILKAHCADDGSLATACADTECEAVEGTEHVKRIVAVDSSPLGRNRRSCIATYTKLWIEVRKIFAKTRDARARGYDGRRFSFNSGDGRCETCKGTGLKDVKMAFLPDATVPCPGCRGLRFNRATLNVRFADRNVADILAMRVDEAAEFFSEMAVLRRLMETFRDVGLGYLTLGQPASTFSGGEAQRVKLATELSSRRTEPTLFVLDEPTCGLHPVDVLQLNALLRRLVDAGNSVLVIEHNTDVMRNCDWLIDVGPGSGNDGGMIVAEGSPGEIAANPASVTGKHLGFGNSSRS